ncbi:exodeoxyribonuclease VII large subunit [Sandaracinobacteroides saxicola]|uniref:Exodeoxyribonuclease 7 large subunit n=1 Tax=Sandaracinobacteroides saxicola TaxID=2759707 RepID=A0A7G5IMC0_9SPHN|nr:exodeoxyribonuclease VII large subunit [Sandaracinobacteroides saxicola]QMW24512.1 exodeoxyribonuclease VII large subunit [Sandaracinobacteroides saxicola]
MSGAPAPNTPEYSVAELAGAIKRTVESAFGLVRVRGEISGLKRAGSGHLYCSLKDADAVIDAVMWKGAANALKFRPEDGLEVVATGRLTTYPGRSKYQIVIERLEVAGVGALLAQLEARRLALAADGLFDAARKRPLPYLPAHIGIVTSPTGAVIRDILHRLADRFPRRVTLWPVLVQGEDAARQVASAIAGFNAMDDAPDLLIVARGGGSIEDLWAFNEEVVVRAAAASAIPLISAVGHETDTTLIDFASDRRAPTPTAAAEMAVPVRAELLDTLTTLALRAARAERRGRGRAKERLAAARLPRPMALTGLKRQRLDELAERLPRALSARAVAARGRLARLALRPALLLVGTAHSHERVARLGERAGRAVVARRERAATRLGSAARLLLTLGPEATLARGYAIVTAPDGRLVRSVRAVPARFALRFADGTVAAALDGAGAAPKRGVKPGPQGSLF